MDAEEFDKVLEARITLLKRVLSFKSFEYSRNNDKLHNFKRAGQMLNISPEKALIGMKVKHDISILDIINDIDNNKLPNIELLEEKIGDAINYLILLEALIKERIYKSFGNR
jgi:hypothetical protein